MAEIIYPFKKYNYKVMIDNSEVAGFSEVSSPDITSDPVEYREGNMAGKTPGKQPGILKLRRRRTLAGQCAAIAVSGTDDLGERIYARQARTRDSGFGADKMSGALTQDVQQPEMTVRTMAQAKYLSKARMEERQRMASGLFGRCVGLPEVRPGRFITASKLSRAVNGTYYVHTVRHVIDMSGYETFFEAED